MHLSRHLKYGKVLGIGREDAGLYILKADQFPHLNSKLYGSKHAFKQVSSNSANKTSTNNVSIKIMCVIFNIKCMIVLCGIKG